MPDKEKSTKKGKSAQGVPLDTVTPLAHEEAEANYAKEAYGDGAVPEPVVPAEHDQERKKEEPIQPQNPKRNQNSKPD